MSGFVKRLYAPCRSRFTPVSNRWYCRSVTPMASATCLWVSFRSLRSSRIRSCNVISSPLDTMYPLYYTAAKHNASIVF